MGVECKSSAPICAFVKINLSSELFFVENKLEGWKEACGAETHEEWIHFAEK